MKAPLITLFCVALLTACSMQKNTSETSPIPVTNTYELQRQASLNAWDSLAKHYNYSYQYTVGFVSWTGYSNQTIITVNKGKVISRKFKETDPNNGVEVSAENTFVYEEDAKSLNTHEQGAKARTISELYTNCANHVKMDTATNTVYFTTFDNQIMKTCGYVPNGCADDCFFGIELDKIKWLK